MYKAKSSNGANNNRSFRTGCLFYGSELDSTLATSSNEDAYKFKSALIESTALDLVGQLDRLAYSKVVCIASHRYEFANRIAPDGRVREPHIHVLQSTDGVNVDDSWKVPQSPATKPISYHLSRDVPCGQTKRIFEYTVRHNVQSNSSKFRRYKKNLQANRFDREQGGSYDDEQRSVIRRSLAAYDRRRSSNKST